MKRLVLLEEYPTDFQVGAEDTVVALTPEASYWLDKSKQAYHLVTDFGTESRLAKLEDGFWEEELLWLDQLDAKLWEHAPELQAMDIHPAILYGDNIKRVIDNVFARGVECTTLLEQGFDRVNLFWGNPPPCASIPVFDFCSQARSVNARLWPLFCSHRGIVCEEKFVAEKNGAGVSTRPSHFRKLAKTSVRRAAGSYDLWRMRRQTSRSSETFGDRRLTLLFLSTGYDHGDLLAAAMREGHCCLVRRENEIVDLHNGNRRFFPLAPLSNGNHTASTRWSETAEEIFSSGSPLWNWPSSWFGYPVTPLLAETFKRWMILTIPELIRLAGYFSGFLSRERVDFVLAPYLKNVIDVAAVAATRRAKIARSVLIAHGDGPDMAKAWDLHELFPYHHYFVPDGEFAAYFRERRALNQRAAAQVHVGSGRWQQYTKLKQRRRVSFDHWDHRLRLRINAPPGGVPVNRPIVVYAASLPEGDERYLNKPSYSEMWYYRLQAALVRVFASLPEYTFIIKLHPAYVEPWGAIHRFVADRRAANLHLSKAPFSLWLPWADRVIFDKPSTTLYETALAGIPHHLLLYRGLAMREAALKKFEKCLTLFEHPQEAAEAVKNYLRTAAPRAATLEPEGPHILATLAGLAKAREEATIT